jgi:hypothetical protein
MSCRASRGDIMTSDHTPGLASWTGLFAGPAAWFLAQQAGAWGVFPHCTDHRAWVAGVNILALIVVLAGGWVSSRARRPVPAGSPASERTRFVAGLSVTAVVIFAFVILLQTYAGVVFIGCER